jgi:hypothetical protein
MSVLIIHVVGGVGLWLSLVLVGVFISSVIEFCNRFARLRG